MIAEANNERLPTLDAGFSLIELLTCVTLIGILASIALPAFSRYIRKAKVSEAGEFLKKIHDGARTYYMDAPQPSIMPVESQYPEPSVGPTPALESCCGQGGKCSPRQSQWETEVWTALSFSVPDPHHYSYAYLTGDPAVGFTARAIGDLDCDTMTSTFEMFGTVNPATGGTTGRGIIRSERPLE
ncbi:MAG: prepilin-type N-terminal cleavage/methylation domain-containing protein [Proteobacteria bacterium]|nr:prepilin-type N-terminal cleavage/methylation domain-containing protein [Pseudomonadota bacterium]